MNMDGVNGITQCPIVPQDHFVYEFNITQYGSSWYHSHYSVQYADGALGPMTLHGPSSAEWDEAINPPLIMTDWSHNYAFDAVTAGVEAPDFLLDGRGNVTRVSNWIANTTMVNSPYSVTFEKPQRGVPRKKYLLRVINTSFSRAFVFSIDNHKLQMASADYVPIYPYYNNSVLVGVGQRYNVIVEATPLQYNDTSSLPTDGNYWIRTYETCGGPLKVSNGFERTGILRYDRSSTADPSSQPWPNFSPSCADETYTSLHPILPWQVPDPGIILSEKQFDLQRNKSLPQPDFPLARWSLNLAPEFLPLRVDYANPTFFHLDNTGPWDPLWRIVPDYPTSNDWVFSALLGPSNESIGAHPMHLHGHDFAVLEQAYDKIFNSSSLTLKLDNPPRRDVVLVPKNGYVVIAFKADNPGAWLIHCHIAFHITEGLGIQIIERQSDANEMWPKESSAQKEAKRVCDNWETWHGDKSNWAEPPDDCSYPNKEDCFQDDSGV